MFDMDETEIFMPDDLLGSDESDSSDELIPGNHKGIIAYPSNWAHNFGANYYAQARELAAFEADGTWQLSEQPQPYSSLDLNVTPTSMLQTSIREIIDDIRQVNSQED